MSIIGILNQKGGVAKTTTASALGFGLAERGKKVLVVDLDAQCNLTTLLGLDPDTIENSVYEVMLKKTTVDKAICSTSYENLDILPCVPDATGLDLEIGGMFQREFIFTRAIEQVKNNYDYIVIDTPPALNTMTTNALIACDYVIIPTDTAVFSMRGIEKLNETINVIRQVNTKLKTLGILITRNKSVTRMNKELSNVIETMAEKFHTSLFNVKIRDQVAVSESQLYQENLLGFMREIKKDKNKENAGTDYEKFVDEVLERIEMPAANMRNCLMEETNNGK